jgi:hypothetical protein
VPKRPYYEIAAEGRLPDDPDRSWVSRHASYAHRICLGHDENLQDHYYVKRLLVASVLALDMAGSVAPFSGLKKSDCNKTIVVE